MDENQDAATRLRQARANAGLANAREAAEALGISYATYAAHENGSRGLGRNADIYARRFKVSLDWLLRNKGPGPAEPVAVERSAPKPPASKANASFPPRYQQFDDTTRLPLRGQTVGGPNGRFILNGNDFASVFCPPQLEGVEGAYALQVYGTSMEPAYSAGDTVWLNPHAPVRSGDDVVVQILGETDGDGVSSYIKRFVSQSAKVLRLKQFNPDEGERTDLEFPADRVFSIHKVAFHAKA